MAGLGGFCILFAGAFLPEQSLKSWGIVVFLFGFGLITLGLLPYRHLMQLEKKPDKIILEENINLSYFTKGKIAFTILIESIAKFAYIEKNSDYGLCIWLKNPLLRKINVQNAAFDMKAFQNRSKVMGGCDLFLPFFTRLSYNEIVEYLNDDHK